MGMRRCESSWRNRRMASRPSVPGMRKSIRIASGDHSVARVMASSPPVASRVPKPTSLSISTSKRRFAGSSSTTSTWKGPCPDLIPTTRRRSATASVRRTSCCHGNVQQEAATVAKLALDSDVSPHQAGELAADRQSQAGAPGVDPGLGLLESLEDALAVDGRHPGPVSSTSTASHRAPSAFRRTATPHRTEPLTVNLMALPSRLIRIWRIFFSSASSTAGTPSATVTVKPRPLLSARSRNMLSGQSAFRAG